jgi:hypothetical protein
VRRSAHADAAACHSRSAARSALSKRGEDGVVWQTSSTKVLLGFCSRCGSTLFWDLRPRDWIAVAMGGIALDTAGVLADFRACLVRGYG